MLADSSRIFMYFKQKGGDIVPFSCKQGILRGSGCPDPGGAPAPQPLPAASRRELLFALISLPFARAANISFTRCRSGEPGHASPHTSARCLKLMPDSLNVSSASLCSPMILSSPTAHTRPQPHAHGAEAAGAGADSRRGAGLPGLSRACHGPSRLSTRARTCWGSPWGRCSSAGSPGHIGEIQQHGLALWGSQHQVRDQSCC